MSLIAVVFGLATGGIVWEILDGIQTRTLKDLYRQEMSARLEHRAREALIRFDHQVESYSSLIRLLAAHRRLTEYLDPLVWFASDESPPVIHAGDQPPWLPEAARWKPLVAPSHVLLLDTGGRVREEFRVEGEPLPADLEADLASYMVRSGVDAFLTALSEKPYLLISSPAEDASYHIMGTLMLVVPIDEGFLRAAQGGALDDVITAVMDVDVERLLITSEPDKLPPGGGLKGTGRRYAVTVQSFGDARNSDLNFQFATFVSRESLREMTSQAAQLSRNQRATQALVFIAVYSLLFTLVSNRLAKALRRLAAFSQRALGFTQPPRAGGNQLLVLEDWMRDYISLVQDAREEMRARHETEIQESEALTAAVMEASLDSIITIDETGRIIDFNPTAEHTFGYSRNEAEGQLLHELLLEGGATQHLRQMLDYCLAAQEEPVADVRSEMEAIRSDGARFPVEIAIKPIELSGYTYFTVYMHDISGRRRQEAEIRSLAAFPSESPSPVLRVNKPGVILYANQASEPLFYYWGCGPGQTLPLNWQRRILAVLETSRPQEVEIESEERVFSLLLAPITELDYVNIYGRDITEARVAEAASRQHQTELVHVCRLSTMGEMATGIAHELNQPLSAIVNYANGSRRRLTAGRVADVDLSESFEQITKQAGRAGEIIKRLRALVAKQPSTRARADVNTLVHEVLSFVDYELRRFGVEVSLDLDPRIVAVRVDLVQIEQVLLNLVRNAIDALRDSGIPQPQIWIRSVQSPDGGVVVSVADNGPGISGKVRARLFEPFFSTKTTGMGMGLAISQTIMEDHGGKIVPGDRPGGGALFRLQIPPPFGQESAQAV
ncbi:MAG: PAS domain S-box protein [Pseudomonadota bacterium]